MPVRIALLLSGCVALVSGCGGGADSPAIPAPPVAAAQPDAPAPVPQPPAPQPPPQPPVGQSAPKPADPPPARNDLAERVVTKALMPVAPTAPVPPATASPRIRVSDLDRGELPLPTVGMKLPPSPLPKGKPALPGTPTERPPLALGDAAAVGIDAFPLPARPTRSAPRPAAPTAADVPALARQLPDHAPTDDPTVDLSAKGVIATPLPLPSSALPYLKSVIPDPFEFAEQLKGKLGKETELGTVPVAVPPEKR